MLRSIAIFFHPEKSAAVTAAGDLADELRRRDVEADITPAWNNGALAPRAAGRDLIIALGGDGTILQLSLIHI